MKRALLLLCLSLTVLVTNGAEQVRLAVDGMTHQHIELLFRYFAKGNDAIKIVAIAESDEAAIERYTKRYNLDKSLFYPTLTELLESVEVDGVMGFNPISEHINTVKACAAKGVDVMVEKPLCLNYREAEQIRDIAAKAGINVLVNYETSWYPSNYAVKQRLMQSASELGVVRKIEVNAGHQGPAEINVYKEFLEWLINPKTNGGGAAVDFGCYGANLSTWIMGGESPISVTALMQTNKPDIYPLLEDEATIILGYEGAQCVIQGSWNWPYSRKDMEVYCVNGYMKAIDVNNYVERVGRKVRDESAMRYEMDMLEYDNPFTYFADVAVRRTKVEATDLASIENNMVVMKILDAALKSAKTSKTVYLK